MCLCDCINHHSIVSISSYSLLYFMIFFLIDDCFTHVTWSSMLRFTWKAGSVIVSTPTLTWPYSIYITASFTVSAIFSFCRITGSLRRQKAATFTFSTLFSPWRDVITAMSKSLPTKPSVDEILKSSLDFNALSFATSFCTYPTILLYFW